MYPGVTNEKKKQTVIIHSNRNRNQVNDNLLKFAHTSEQNIRF